MGETRRRHLRVVVPTEDAASSPRVWLLLGARQGDNAQVTALGRALTRDLGWPHEIKQMHYDAACAVPFRHRGASLIGVDLDRSAPLAAPWPDVVIGIGRRAAPVSRWLKAQSQGRMLAVHLGRPRTAYQHFDLIVTTPQYALPPADNVIRLTLPIILHDERALETEAARWLPSFAHLPRPWTAVLIGGPTTRLRFDREVGAGLLAGAKAHAGPTGRLLATTSPRTDPAVADLLAAELGTAHFLHRWAPGKPNPYQALLQLADDFIVTDDSVSMIAEAADRMKPLYIFEVPSHDRARHPGVLQGLLHRFADRREDRLVAGLRPDLADRVLNALTRIGYARPRRSIAVFDRALYQTGLARPLGAGDDSGWPTAWSRRRLPQEERDAVVAKIRDAYRAKETAHRK